MKIRPELLFGGDACRLQGSFKKIKMPLLLLLWQGHIKPTLRPVGLPEGGFLLRGV